MAGAGSRPKGPRGLSSGRGGSVGRAVARTATGRPARLRQRRCSARTRARRVVAGRAPGRQVVLHDLADLGLAQPLVGAKRVLDARRWVRRAGGDEPQVLRRVGVVAELTEATRQFRRGSQRRHAVATDEPRDRGVVHPRLLRQLPLGHLLDLELGSQPFIERSTVLGRHRLESSPLGRCRESSAVTALSRSGRGPRHHPLVPRRVGGRAGAKGTLMQLAALRTPDVWGTAAAASRHHARGGVPGRVPGAPWDGAMRREGTP